MCLCVKRYGCIFRILNLYLYSHLYLSTNTWLLRLGQLVEYLTAKKSSTPEYIWARVRYLTWRVKNIRSPLKLRFPVHLVDTCTYIETFRYRISIQIKNYCSCGINRSITKERHWFSFSNSISKWGEICFKFHIFKIIHMLLVFIYIYIYIYNHVMCSCSLMFGNHCVKTRSSLLLLV